jgi:hypothetical protein
MRLWGITFLSLVAVFSVSSGAAIAPKPVAKQKHKHKVKGQAALGSLDAASTADPASAEFAADAAATARSPAAESCRSSDPNRLCLALKYAVFADDAGPAPITEAQAASAVRSINSVWAKCDVAFQLEQFVIVNPAEAGIRYHIGSYTDLDAVRTAFGSDKTLLIAATGAWDRAGSLGDTGANAWTAMPGGAPYGAVIESSVGNFANIIGHELGHYLNLYHRGDATNLMNPIIYSSSTGLSPDQCRTARETVRGHWQAMLR